MDERSRRSVIATGAVSLAALAGCLGDGADTASPSGTTAIDGATAADDESAGGDEPAGGDDTPAGGDGTPTAGDGTPTDGKSGGTDTTAAAAGTSTDELDLREANVVGIEFESNDGGYRFSVTLHHDDDGEDGYANWWQVERLDGTQLGRRTLLHAHSTAPFTRSETIDTPGDVTCVVVRGHDQTHGYGGRATLVNLDTGATRAVDQGPDKRSFAESGCP